MTRFNSEYPMKNTPSPNDRIWGLDFDGGSNVGFELSKIFGNMATLRQSGAVGDGIANDTTAIQNAINDFNEIDGEGLTYRILSTLIGKAKLKISNATFLADLAENTDVIRFEGTQNNEITLTSDIIPGSNIIAVPSGSAFFVDQWCYLSSNEDFSVDAKNGELVRIKSISGNNLSLYGDILLRYETGQTAKIRPLNFITDIVIENVHIIGQNVDGNRTGIRFIRCSNVEIINMISDQFQYSHIVFDRCAFSKVNSGYGAKTGTQIGLNYGVAVLNACYAITIDGYQGDSMRHLTTIGGSQGVSRFISVVKSKGFNITDAGIDAHSSVHEHTFDGNMIHFSTGGSGMDGIISQGSCPIITNNQLYGPKREGVIWQPLQKNSFEGSLNALIDNNIANNPQNTGAGNGVLVSTEPIGENWKEIDAVTISNFQGSGFLNNVQILSRKAAIRNVDIINVSCTKPSRARSVYIRSIDQPVVGVSILAGHHEVDSASTNPVIELFGSEDVMIQNWKVTGTTLKRSSTGVGIRLNYTEKGWETANLDVGISTKVLVQNSTGEVLDTRGGSNFNHITQTANHSGVFQPNPQHAWDVGGSVNIPYTFAYRANGHRLLQKDETSKDIFIGEIDEQIDPLDMGRVIIREKGQNVIWLVDGKVGFGINPSGAKYHFDGDLRLDEIRTLLPNDISIGPLFRVGNVTTGTITPDRKVRVQIGNIVLDLDAQLIETL